MPGLGTGGSKFQISVGWRYAKASRSYFNSRLNHDFTDLWKPVERLSILDVTAGYRVSKRVSLIASLPIVTNNFSTLLPPLSPSRGQRYSWNANGIGDLVLYGQGAVLDQRTHPFGNIALGAGLKIPTGNWDVRANIPDQAGRNVQQRAVYPPAIMPGDGGVGVIVGFAGFKTFRKFKILRDVSFSAAGSYLINARNTNGTQSMISSLGSPLSPIFLNRLTNSVTDSYNLNVAISRRPPGVRDNPYLKGLKLNIFGRIEGVPTTDFIGRSDGFRQPGYAISVGPGAAYTYKKDTVIVEVPIVFNRYIDPGATALPGLPVRGGPAPFNPNRQMGLVAPASIQVRYVRSL